MGPRLRGDDVNVLLPSQHTDASVDAAAMIAVGDIANGGRPFERVKPKARQMHANARLLAEDIARCGNFRGRPELSNTRQPAATRALWLAALVDADNADVSIISDTGSHHNSAATRAPI